MQPCRLQQTLHPKSQRPECLDKPAQTPVAKASLKPSTPLQRSRETTAHSANTKLVTPTVRTSNTYNKRRHTTTTNQPINQSARRPAGRPTLPSKQPTSQPANQPTDRPTNQAGKQASEQTSEKHNETHETAQNTAKITAQSRFNKKQENTHHLPNPKPEPLGLYPFKEPLKEPHLGSRFLRWPGIKSCFEPFRDRGPGSFG